MEHTQNYYSSRLNMIDEHVIAAERFTERITQHDCGNLAMMNALLAGVLALVEISRTLTEIKEEISHIELKIK